MDFGIGDQIDIALSVAGFDVGQPMPLFRKRTERLAQKCQLANFDGEFIGFCPEEIAGHADPVAQIELFGHRVGLSPTRDLS